MVAKVKIDGTNTRIKYVRRLNRQDIGLHKKGVKLGLKYITDSNEPLDIEDSILFLKAKKRRKRRGIK